MATLAAHPVSLPQPESVKPSPASTPAPDADAPTPTASNSSAPASIKKEAPIKSPPPPPARPPIRPKGSKFDLELNPFEQSFSRSSHSVNSSGEDREPTPQRGGDETATKSNNTALPPLSALTSPAADPNQFPWLQNHSLRSGPLSPAMLQGPTAHPHPQSQLNPATKAPAGTLPQAQAFDPNSFRTGFTPGTSTGYTPGSYGFGVNLPMPSPNTAAFLNMVTNGTPVGEGEQAPPQQQPAPPPLQLHHGLQHLHQPAPSDVQQETITPGTLSALTGVYNDMQHQQQQPPPPPPPQQQPQQQQQPPPAQYFNQPMPPQGDYAQQSANAASQAANGLFLLTQAHHELSKRDEQSKRGGEDDRPARNLSKRKSEIAPPPPKSKKAKKQTHDESVSPAFSGAGSDGVDESKLIPGSLPGGKETEEEKRKNFLERNRQAALKCRQRKKAWLGELQSKVEVLSSENERLNQTVAQLHEEINRMSQVLVQHRDCGLGMPPGVGYGRAGMR